MSTRLSNDIRLADVMAALSLATDLGMGQPLEFALRACVLSVRLGEKLGFSDQQLRGAYYQALLRYIGCNADTHLLAAIVGDELALRTEAIHADNAGLEIIGLLTRFIRQANEGASAWHMAQALLGGVLAMNRIQHEFFTGHCEVAQRLAERLGFDPDIVRSISQVYARWDGKGIPPLKGEAIAPSLLVVSLAQDAAAFYRLGGVEAAIHIVRQRSGKLYAPRHVEVFVQYAHEFLSGLEDEPTWDMILSIEPGRKQYLTAAQFDTACAAIADYADIKSPFTLGHSRRVAELSEAAARLYGLPEADTITVRRAGWLHDLGKVGVTARIWTKPGALTEKEWELVRMHPYYTERVLARSESLAPLGVLGGSHHERLDGSGYHRGVNATQLSTAARILATANRYQALIETRSHRPACPPDLAAETLRDEVKHGKLDHAAVDSVLAAAGHRVSARSELVAGLSEREVEVLRLIARGHSIKAVAQQLSIAPKTVDSHIQHIYNKIGVSTRAGAALFAMENRLLSDA